MVKHECDLYPPLSQTRPPSLERDIITLWTRLSFQAHIDRSGTSFNTSRAIVITYKTAHHPNVHFLTRLIKDMDGCFQKA